MNPENDKLEQEDLENNETTTPSSEQVAGSSSPPANQTDQIRQDSPADALSRTPEDLAEEIEAEQVANPSNTLEPAPVKKVSPIRRFLRRINLYFLIFLMLVAVAVVFAVVHYLNSKKEPEVPAIATQELTQEALQQLANTDASVGDANQTLTIQGNAIINGQTLMRGNLNIAGNLQTGGSIQGSNLTISGLSNLGETQINSLQVASNLAIQGSTTMRDINVAGTSSFGGAMTASQITVTNLIMSGNASLQVPNHISFTGPSPGRNINPAVLGGGGSASVNGSDTTGTVNINTGAGPTAGCLVRINFNQRFTNQPHVIISPVGVAAGLTQYYVDRDQGGFSICASSPAPAHQAFAFDYFVTN